MTEERLLHSPETGIIRWCRHLRQILRSSYSPALHACSPGLNPMPPRKTEAGIAAWRYKAAGRPWGGVMNYIRRKCCKDKTLWLTRINLRNKKISEYSSAAYLLIVCSCASISTGSCSTHTYYQRNLAIAADIALNNDCAR